MNKNIRIEVKDLEPIINLATFLYSQNVTYDSTQKIIRLYTLFLDIEPDEIIENIGWNIERYEGTIFSNFSNDWIDLLLFLYLHIIYKLVRKLRGL